MKVTHSEYLRALAEYCKAIKEDKAFQKFMSLVLQK